MATIPGLPPRSKMPGIPDVRMGVGNVSAADFGGEQFQDLYRLGQAVQRDGNAQMQWAIRKYDERAEAEATTAMANYMDTVGKRRDELFTKKGQEAFTTRKDLETFSTQQADTLGQNLTTDRAKEFFGKSRQNYDLQNNQAADRHTLREQDAYRQTAIAAENEKLSQDALAMNGDEVRIASNLQQIKANNARLYAGQPQDFIDVKNNDAVMTVTQQVAEARAREFGPKAALDFLNSGIDVEFTTPGAKAKFELLKKQYSEASDSKFISDTAMLWVDSDFPSDDIMKRAYDMYPDDPKSAQFLIGIADNYRARKIDTQNREITQAKSEAWSFFAKGGFNVDSIPIELRNSNPTLFREMVDYSTWFNKAGNEKLDPDLGWLDRMRQMKPSELRAWLEGPPMVFNEGQPGEFSIGRYDFLMRKAGNSMDEVNKIRERSLKSDEEVRASGGGSGSGSGGSSSVNPDDWFENNYGAMYETGWWWKSPAAYDPKSQEAKNQGNGFRVRYKDRLAQEEKQLGRKANPEEQKSVAFQLIRDVRDGVVKLDSPYFDEQQAAATAGEEMPVQKTSLTPDQQRLAGGNEVYAVGDPGAGTVRKFARLKLNSVDVPADAAYLKPESAVRALDRGEFGGIAYEPGDVIVRGENGVLSVFGQNMEFKGGRIPPATSAAQGQAAKPAIPEPAKSKEILALEKKGVAFQWNGEVGKWVGSGPDGMRHIVERNGKERKDLRRIVGKPLPNQDERERASYERLLAAKDDLKGLEAKISNNTRMLGNLGEITLRRQIEEQKAEVAKRQAEYDEYNKKWKADFEKHKQGKGK